MLKHGEQKFRLLRKSITAFYEFMQFFFAVGPKASIYKTAKQYLKSNQVDPMKFGYHCKLLDELTNYQKKSIEDIMDWYLEGVLHEKLGINEQLMLRWKIDNPKEFLRDLEWFYNTIQKNVFKRIQAPPIILTSKSSYGYDIRESILPVLKTKRFLLLQSKIEKLDIYQSNKKLIN